MAYFPAKKSSFNFYKNNEKYNDSGRSFILPFKTGLLKLSPIPTQNKLTFQVLFATALFTVTFLSSFTTALPTRRVRSHTSDNISTADLVLKRHSTPTAVKVAYLRPHNYSTEFVHGGNYSASPSIVPTTRPQNVTISPQQAVSINNNNNNNNHTNKSENSSVHSTVLVLGAANESTVVPPPETTPSKNVNLAVIPVLGIFFLMMLVCVKGCSWFREHLKEHDIEDDGKDYVILSPPEEGYREVEFRSDTSSMYYDTVSSYRSILRQKGDLYGYNNYDTVTSIRSILQRADVRDAAVQVRLQSRRPDRWKSVSGILNNGGGSGSNLDLLRVPKKTHRQVSFQTNNNESYPPPSPRMRDVNIQVGVSTMERWKQQQGKASKFQNGLSARQISPGHGHRNSLLSALPSRHSSASLRNMDRATEGHPLTRTDSTGGASSNSNSTVTNAWPGAVAKPKNRRFHHFQVLRVNSTDRLGSRIDVSPLCSGTIPSHYTSQNQSVSSLSNVDSLGDPQDRLGRPERSSSTLIDDRHGELYGAPMTTMCHPHYFCDQFAQTDSDSANDAMSPATAAAHTSFSPPILTEVKLSHPQSENEDLDALDDGERNSLIKDGKRHELYIGDSSDTTGEDSLVTSGRNSASWSEQMDEEDELQKLLQAHASAIARAPIASPISMDSTSSSCNTSTDDVAQRVELDRIHHIGTEAGDATTASEDSGEVGRNASDQLNSGQPGDGEQRDEETSLIEQSFTDIGSSPYSQSPDIGSGTLTITRPHRVSSGYDTQGPESSSVKGPAEAGDSSCDVTPLTSSSNSLQEFGRDASKIGLHSQLPLQLLMYQHLQLEERALMQKAAELENRHLIPSSYPVKDTVPVIDTKVPNPLTMDQPLSYIPQIPPPDSPNIPAPLFQTNNINNNKSDIDEAKKDDGQNFVRITPIVSSLPTITDDQRSNPAVDSTSETLETNDNNDSVSKLYATSGLTGSDDDNRHLQTPTSNITNISNITDNFRAPAAQVDDPVQMTAKAETLPKVVNPLTTLPPPPTKGATSAYQARKKMDTTIDPNGNR